MSNSIKNNKYNNMSNKNRSNTNQIKNKNENNNSSISAMCFPSTRHDCIMRKVHELIIKEKDWQSEMFCNDNNERLSNVRTTADEVFFHAHSYIEIARLLGELLKIRKKNSIYRK